jgi:hypothetical protein
MFPDEGGAVMAGQTPTHGLFVRSDRGLRLRDEKSRRLMRRMKIAMPWLTPADEPACRAWAQIEIIADTVHTILRRDGVVNPATGEARRILQDFRLLRQAQLSYAVQLGMTPLARAALKLRTTDNAMDLAALCARSDSDSEEEVDPVAINGQPF